MSWTDRIAIETIKQLRDDFNIDTFIETGTFKGINAKIHSKNFEEVWTCDINDCVIDEDNVIFKKAHSPKFLTVLKVMEGTYGILDDKAIIYLDAHFYDSTLPKDKRFVVLEELEALKDSKKYIIIVHDFDNGEFGHITYDGQPLNFELLKDKLLNVNPNFHFYTNTKCDIYTEHTLPDIIKNDPDAIDNIRYANSSKEKRERGILYCVPRKLDLKKYKLRKI